MDSRGRAFGELFFPLPRRGRGKKHVERRKEIGGPGGDFRRQRSGPPKIHRIFGGQRKKRWKLFLPTHSWVGKNSFHLFSYISPDSDTFYYSWSFFRSPLRFLWNLRGLRKKDRKKKIEDRVLFQKWEGTSKSEETKIQDRVFLPNF